MSRAANYSRTPKRGHGVTSVWSGGTTEPVARGKHSSSQEAWQRTWAKAKRGCVYGVPGLPNRADASLRKF